MKKILGALLALALTTVGMAGLAAPASASGSDSPTPYTVNALGITLPAGDVFQDNGHVNIKSDSPHHDLHFESKCIYSALAECAGDRHEAAQFIGKSFIPWSAFGLSGKFCVSWVQISHYNAHQGEGKHDVAVCVGTTPPTEEPPTEEPPTVFEPHIQDYIGACDAESREAKFVLDNSGSNVDVTYVVDGASYVVAAGKGKHVSAGLVPAEGKTYVITAGDKTWSFEAKPCITPEPPVVDIAPAAAASIVATCGAAEVTLTNPDDDKYTARQTASFVVYVDGKFYGAYAVAADQSEKVSLTFPEDSGDRVVTVRTGPAFGDELLATATVDSNCVIPPTEEPTEEPTEPPVTEEPTEEPSTPPVTEEPTEEPSTPPVTEEPTQEPTEEPVVKPSDGPKTPSTPVSPSKAPQASVKAPVASAPLSQTVPKTLPPKVSESDLAHTGAAPVLGGLLGALLLMGGIGALALKRRRTN